MSEQTTDLLNRAQGNRDAKDAAYRRVERPLRALVGKHVRRERPKNNIWLTEVVHDVFLKLIERRDWKSKMEFLLWVGATTGRDLIDRARKREAKKRRGEVEDQPLERAAELAAKSELAPDRMAMRQEVVALLNAALETLKPEWADVVTLTYYQGLSLREIGQRLGVSKETVRIRLNLALRALHNELAPLLGDDASGAGASPSPTRAS